MAECGVKVSPSDEDRQARAGERARVLVVDDDATLRSAYRRVLSRDFEAVLAATGAEALELIDQGAHFDAVVIDLIMPEMDGLELYALMVKLAPELDSRIIFVTGGETSLRAQRFMHERRNIRIYKPFEPSELCRILAMVAAS